MATLTYEQLIKQLNQAMLAGEANRVPLLRRVLVQAGHPDQQAPRIHVVGTNGKGSTVALLARTIQAGGYRVAVFASPAILDQREQLTINGEMIEKTVFVRCYEQLLPAVEAVVGSADRLTIFEWLFLIAMQWFANQHVDLMIIEAGLGGQFDATNAITVPLMSVFTHIALDHTRLLGQTIGEIATNKAGIIKPQTTVVIAPQQAIEATTAIKKVASAQHVPVITASLTAFSHIHLGLDETTLTIDSSLGCWSGVSLNLVGRHQLATAATVLTVLVQLSQRGWQLGEDAVRSGFKEVHLLGRFTQVPATRQHPALILDGAHNPDAMAALVTTLRELAPNQKFTFILGFLADKNIPAMLTLLLPLADNVILTTPDQPTRALAVDDLAELVADEIGRLTLSDLTVYQAADMNEVRQLWQTSWLTTAAPVIVTGSFYLIRALEEAAIDG